MSRIPFLDELGDALESAARRAATTPSRQRGWAVATAAFVSVILVGAIWWAMAPRPDTVTADLQGTSTTTPPSLAAPGPLPTEWGRVRPQTALSGEDRLSLSGVVWDGDRFVAVGTDRMGEGSAGVILVSPDGTEWTELARIPDIALHDIAFGDVGLVAVGTRGFLPISAQWREGGAWEIAMMPLPTDLVGTDQAGQADAVAATESGFIAGGSVQSAGDDMIQWPVLWESTDGWAWSAVVAPVFGPAAEATVHDIAVADDTVVAVGLVAQQAGISIPVAWTPTSGGGWERLDMPLGDDDHGFAGALGVDRGATGWVAVGFAPGTSGRTGAAWTSSDGSRWERISDPDGEFGGTVANASTQMHDVTATRDGYVAVGATLERPTGRYLIWTSPDGGVWQRLDLEDPNGGLPTTSAHSVVSSHDLVVAVGAAFDINGDLGQGAVWLGPPPSDVTASLPLVADEPVEEATPLLVLNVDPDRAVHATQVRVRGRIPADAPQGDVVVVWLHSPSGAPQVLCEAKRQGRNFDCRVRLGDLPDPPSPGDYSLTVEETEPVAAAGATLEVLPEGSTVMALSAVYSSNWWPLLQSLHVRNKGADPVDVGGWKLENAGGSGTSFVFPAGTIVAPGSSVTVAFGATYGAACPEDTESFFNWCRVVGDSGTVTYTDADAFWKGGAVTLVDPGGTIHDTWEAPG